MASNYRQKLIDATKNHASAQVEMHITNVEVLLGSHVGVAEHPNLIETIENELEKAARYQDIHDMAEKYLK